MNKKRERGRKGSVISAQQLGVVRGTLGIFVAMGRAKRRIELLSNQKERCRTFVRRMEGLKKKAHELKTLCNVEICLIVDNVPKAEKGDHRIDVPQIWPSDPDLIKNLIISHRNQPSDNPLSRPNLSTFLEAQNKKIKKEILKLKGKNEGNMYPAWDDSYNVLSRVQLEEFGGLIAQKIQFLKTRIEAMRCSNKSKSDFYHEPEQSRESDYFQKQIAPQNEFYFPGLISCKQYEAGKSFDSSNQTSMASGSSSSRGGASSYDMVSLEPPRDGNYFQNRITAQNELNYSCPISCIYPEIGNSSDSSENKFYAENQVAKLSTENDMCYTELEDLYSSEYLSGFMDWPVSDNFDHPIANIEDFFDMDTRVVSQFSGDLKAENVALERSFSTKLDEFLSFR